jgi:hypothetical protein
VAVGVAVIVDVYVDVIGPVIFDVHVHGNSPVDVIAGIEPLERV